MALYKATKNLHFASLGNSVIVDEHIELEDDHAAQVNKDLKTAFPDVKAVLVPVDEAEAPKKTTRAKKADTETVEDDDE